MERFEYIDGALHHYKDEVLLATVSAENVEAYRVFVPEAPAPEASTVTQQVPGYLAGHVELVATELQAG